MSALRALIAAMPEILAVVDGCPPHMRERVYDTLVNAALSDAGQQGWATYDQGQYAGSHGETTLMPRLDGNYDPRMPRTSG